MASLRFGSFKPNWWALGLAGAFSLAFIVYIAGFTTFKRNYTALYDAQNEAALNNMKWFLVGCPILMLVTSILLFVVASFESRQILLGVRNLVEASITHLYSLAHSLLDAEVSSKD